MKKIKFLLFLLILSSCNKYLGTVDPDYSPKKEVTEIFSNDQIDENFTSITLNNILYPQLINPSLNVFEIKIDKISNTDKDSVFELINDKIILSKEDTIITIDNYNKIKIKYDLNLNKGEKVLNFFDYKNKIYIFTNRSRIFFIEDNNVIELANFEIFTNATPILIDKYLILLSVFGDIFEIKLDDFSISKKANFNSKPGISIKSNIFEDQENLYYLFNSGTLLTFDKKNYEYKDNYILEDLNILSSLRVFNELINTPFSFNNYLYFIDKSGKIAAYNPVTSEIFWEIDLNSTILNYQFSNNGYLIILTLENILILSNNGKIINSYTHNQESPKLFFNINKNIYLISEEGISSINFNNKSEEKFYKNKFSSNLEIYFKGLNIYLKDDKSLFKLSE